MSFGQLRIKGEVYFDEIGTPTAQVKLFKDNKVDQEFETNKKGKFSVMLDAGHDYLFEVSKDYHYTTRFIVSTKLPYVKDQEDFYASFDVILDLIRVYEGLDASIMDNPIMILRNLEEGGFGFDEKHLEAVRSRVENLMDESEKLKSKGAKPLLKPVPVKPKKVIATKPPEPEPKEEVVEKAMEVTPTHAEEKAELTEVRTEKEEAIEKSEVKEEPQNETYEMKLRRERIEKERQRKENLALKRGYETSLIRQVAEESKRMNSSEYEQKKKVKEDSSLYLRENKEQELMAYKSQQAKKKEAEAIVKSENQKQKQQFEKNLIKDVAASRRFAITVKEGSKAVGEETSDGEKFYLKPKIYETTKEDQFKTIRTIHIDYPSNSKQFSVEKYQFGMINYYINQSVVEKETFCKTIKELELTKYQLPCD